MTRPTTRGFLAFVLICTAPAFADPPRINGISPFGVQRGESTEITINGANLTGNPQLVTPFPQLVDPRTMPNAVSMAGLRLHQPLSGGSGSR